MPDTPFTKWWCISTNFFCSLWQQISHSDWNELLHLFSGSHECYCRNFFPTTKTYPTFSPHFFSFSTCIFENPSCLFHLFLHSLPSPVLVPSLGQGFAKRLQKRQVRSVYLLSSFPWTVQIIAILISSFTHLLNKLSAWLLLNFCCYSQWLLRSHLPIFWGVCNIVNHNLLLESKLLWASSVWNASGFAPNHSLIVASQLPTD